MSLTASGTEIVLPGGMTNAGLVCRVGDTVRRPRRRTSQATVALLNHLEDVGFDGAPRYLGVDGRGREVLTYIPGEAAIPPYADWMLSDDALISVAELLRRYHDAVASFDPSSYEWPHPLPDQFRGNLVSHNDPNLDNVIFVDGRAVALIDFDLAGPGSRAWDLACCARLWAPLRPRRDVPEDLLGQNLERLAMFADAYRASGEERAAMVDALVECHRWCYKIIDHAAARGHEVFGRYWSGDGRAQAQRTSRWLASHRRALRAVLGVESRPAKAARRS